jgi:hypothetical protein
LADHHEDGLEAELAAEAKHAVSELLALLVGQDLMREVLLEAGKSPEAGTAPLGSEDPHGEDVLANLAPHLVIGAAAGLRLIVHAVCSWPRARGHEVHVGGDTLYVAPVLAVELEGTLGAGASLDATFFGGVA